MSEQTFQLVVRLGASQTRKRLKGHGLGVRRVETAGNGRSVVFHTATGEHLARLKSLLFDVLEPQADPADDDAGC